MGQGFGIKECAGTLKGTLNRAIMTSVLTVNLESISLRNNRILNSLGSGSQAKEEESTCPQTQAA